MKKTDYACLGVLNEVTGALNCQDYRLVLMWQDQMIHHIAVVHGTSICVEWAKVSVTLAADFHK
jgi:hypothetical protein